MPPARACGVAAPPGTRSHRNGLDEGSSKPFDSCKVSSAAGLALRMHRESRATRDPHRVATGMLARHSPSGRDMRAPLGRVARICLVTIAVSACAGTVLRPLLGMRDTRVSHEQAMTLARVTLVPVQVRPAVLANARGSRWEDPALLADDGLFEVLRQVARDMKAGGVHHVQVADQGIIVMAAPNEPQVMLDRWVKSDDTSAETSPAPSADVFLEVAWAPFAPPIRHAAVTMRLVDPGSGRVLGRALRLIIDSGFPPKLNQGRAAVESGARGVGLVTRE